MPGACAPSTSVSTPRRSSSRTIAPTGRTSAVGEVTWLTRANRVRVGHRLEVRLERLRGVADRERDPDDDDARAVACRGGPQRVERRVVLVVAGQELVAGLEPQRGEDGRDAGRRVGHERDAVGIRLEEHRDPLPRLVEVPLELAAEEPDGLRLHALAPHALGLEHRVRAGAERAVVEVGDVAFEEPRGAVGGAGGSHVPTIADPASRPMPRPVSRAAASRPGRRSRAPCRPAASTRARPRPATVHAPPGRPRTSVCSASPSHADVAEARAPAIEAAGPVMRQDRVARQRARGRRRPRPASSSVRRAPSRPALAPAIPRRRRRPAGSPPTPASRAASAGIRSGSPPGRWTRCADASGSHDARVRRRRRG